MEIPYEILEHPADLRIRAYGETKEELFHNTALGVLEVVFGTRQEWRGPQGKTITVYVEAPDEPALLAEWLTEVLFHAENEDSAFTDIFIQRLTTNECSVSMTPIHTRAFRDVKGVVKENLEITHDGDRWQATVTVAA